MGFKSNEMGLGCFKGVLHPFPGGHEHAYEFQCIQEFTHQELQTFCPKHSFVVAHEHAHKISLFFMNLLTNQIT